MIRLITVYPLLVCLSNGQVLPFDESEAFTQTIDLSTLTPILQNQVVITSSIGDTEGLSNVTILFDDSNSGDFCFEGGCLNPTITIMAETIDTDQDDEFLEIYFGSYADESLIGRCGNHTVAEICGTFADCIQEYQLPDGCYNALNLFIYQSEEVDAFCGDRYSWYGDGEEGAVARGVRLRVMVSCDAQGQCEESECGEGQDSRRRLGGNLLENELEDETVETTYDLEMECKAYDDVFTGFLVFVAICWIVQCGGFYVYKKSKKN